MMMADHQFLFSVLSISHKRVHGKGVDTSSYRGWSEIGALPSRNY